MTYSDITTTDKPNQNQYSWQDDMAKLESVMGNTNYTDSIDGSLPTPAKMQFGGGSGRGFLDKFNPDTKEVTQGWGMPAIQGISAAAGAYLGYQQLKLGQSQLEQNKKIFNLNFGAQAQTLNTRMEDRQRSLVGAAEGTNRNVESVDSYLSKHAIKTQGI